MRCYIVNSFVFIDFFTLFLLALALSMDAFAVSVSMGMTTKLKPKEALISASSFGLFQGSMPLLGFLASLTFKNIIDNYSYIIAFILLSFIGIKMIYETYKERNTAADENISFSIKTLFILSIATSIDAFAAGISLTAININIYISILSIAIITFLVCLIGIYFGKKVGCLFKHKAQILGGVVLIAIGIKLFLEGLH